MMPGKNPLHYGDTGPLIVPGDWVRVPFEGFVLRGRVLRASIKTRRVTVVFHHLARPAGRRRALVRALPRRMIERAQ